jgi:N-acetylglucosamine kinase-like BadF-type ATPase
MKLIVESGSSKADWVLCNGDELVLEFQTKGWNPLFMGVEEMRRKLNSLTQLNELRAQVKKVHFYSPGVSTQEPKDRLEEVLDLYFEYAQVYVESDLLAAARSVYKGKPLFISIIGTGSNAAFFDGELLEQEIPSLGYVLGDEGSGASLGKKLLRDYLYQKLPTDLHIEFSKKHSISKELVLKSVYKQPHANRFLASYVPFLVEYKNHVYVKHIVREEFKLFIETHLCSNKLIFDFPISFVGSVAYFFQEILTQLCAEYNLQLNSIVRSPIKGLISYHTTSK